MFNRTLIATMTATMMSTGAAIAQTADTPGVDRAPEMDANQPDVDRIQPGDRGGFMLYDDQGEVLQWDPGVTTAYDREGYEWRRYNPNTRGVDEGTEPGANRPQVDRLRPNTVQ